MGRLSRSLPSPSSGALIFYGRNGSGSSSLSQSAQTVHSSSSNTSSTTSTPVQSNSDVAELDGSKLDSNNHLSLKAITELPQDALTKTNQVTLEKVTANGKAALRLVKELNDAFSEVPYVKVVVSLVQQIITISDEIQANKERSQELVGKVATYGRVVFEALLAINGQESASEDISGIKEDLLQVASVLQSIYDILNSLTTSKAMSRFNRTLFREDIASKLSQQDRRLDTTITAFQLKSSIVLRSGHVENNTKKVVDSQLSRDRLLQSRGLRSKPQIVFGRNKEIDAIVKAVLQHGSTHHDKENTAPPRVCILGSGGIGKTTVALSVIHHEDIQKKFDGQRFFTSCEAATSTDLLISGLVTTLELDVEETKVNTLQTILRRLRHAPCLLILDNFETPWDPLQNRPSVENLLAELTSLETVTLILTMRGSQRPAGTLWSQVVPPLQPVDEASAISIFKAIANKDDQYVVSLIRAVDCVPLAVTLLANLAAVDGETTKALWSRWKEEYTSMIENGGDRLNNIEVSIQLSLSSSRMRRDPGALSLLSALSLLPDGVSSKTLEACVKGFPDTLSIKKAISTLRQNALVYEDSNKDLRILSLIRLYICRQYPPSSKARSFIYDYFTKLALHGTSYHDPSIRSTLQREANNISAILVDALAFAGKENVDTVIQATINFCHFTYVSGKGSSQAIGFAVEKLETLQISSTNSVPSSAVQSSQSHIGALWYRTFGRFSKSGRPPSVNSAVQLPVHGDPRLRLQADCLGCWGQILSRQREFDLAREKFIQAHELHTKVGDTSGQAYDLLNHGLLLSRNATTLEEALDLFRKAQELHEKLNDKAGVAHDLLSSGHAFRDLGKFLDAKSMFTVAARLFEEFGDVSGQVSALNGLGAIMLYLSKCSEAEEVFTKTIELSKDTGDVVSEAESVAGLAVAFLLQSRFPEAKRTIEKAMLLRQPVIDPDHLYILGRVFIATEDYEEARSRLTQSLSYYEDTSDPRGQAENLLELAFITFQLGDIWQAQKFIMLAGDKAPNNKFFMAEACVLQSQIWIRTVEFGNAAATLERVLLIFEEVGSCLGQAQCLYLHAIKDIRCAEPDAAIEKLNKALDLHVEVGNTQGQADDMNKICEALMHQGAINESMALIAKALALHVRIGDKSGQGDDLYIQASLFLVGGRFMDAEMTMRKALKFHTAAQSLYGIARDNASLSDIIWQKQRQEKQGQMKGESTSEAVDPFVYLGYALKIFRDIRAAEEFIACRAQRRRMRGREPLDIGKIDLPDWYLTDDEDDEDGGQEDNEDENEDEGNEEDD
ncbi:hypothetical protein CPB84DRAFT_761367 [Gymnopilus junonius]|uniref:AAA+ ATPase domain-containing protein n=1 Tax=Gymnopilus junonius TaxID=109634 RepID=A0A9P5NXV9_GYMJU|nr:hypothetical protein CPB84DRAFT_761367 [Gymnopilus junonius]